MTKPILKKANETKADAIKANAKGKGKAEAKKTKVKAVKAEKTKVKAVKAEEAVPEPILANKAYSFVIKGPKTHPTTILSIDGKDRVLKLGSAHQFTFNQLKAPLAIKAIFEGILAEIGPTHSGLTLSCKSAYKGAHFGMTKQGKGHSWFGFITYTDGELCSHAWPKRSLTKDALIALAQGSNLKPNRQGANWFTISITNADVSKAIEWALKAIRLLK